ncbi:uncharacterized protein BO97DRAFT_455286 [Aspergillus homomorphus CBS 101889]|uniref:Uncharacterized protein n=1 Tax=Aspergillus homomorphus (strain CBS 101889) TaxID=1450537 RepID=A0A395HUM7_ASPHC|nr:hypothetical protein BO97DRAFT_455286 [Aspergillus homomorphus CBS 101889]RAL10538.1 hypothetical protein BO97DRAFT_455286 [Aspergillus homomorphus CBS 101889]
MIPQLDMYKKVAGEIKRKHAEDRPDYHHTPRKPSKKKRRGSSRPDPKLIKRSRTLTATCTALDVAPPTPEDSNISAPGTNVQTPNSIRSDSNVVIGTDKTAMSEGPWHFSATELDNLIAEFESENQRAMIFASANYGMNERLAGERFELSDFLADIYYIKSIE